MDEFRGIRVEDPDSRLGLAGNHEILVHGEYAHSRGQVAAVALPIYLGFIHRNLAEGIVHIGILPLRGSDDADLASEGVGAAQAVDLAQVGAAQEPEDDLVAQGSCFRQLVSLEIKTLAGPSPDYGTGKRQVISLHRIAPGTHSTG